MSLSPADLDRLLEPAALEEPARLRAVFERLPELATTATHDERLLSLLLDCLESAPEPLATAAVLAALAAGGPLARRLWGLPRPLPWRGGLASRVLSLPEGRAARLLARLYPRRERLSLAELAAASALGPAGPTWLARQRDSWGRNRGRAVSPELLPLLLAQRPPRPPLYAPLRLVQAPGVEARHIPLLRGLIRRSAAEPRAAFRLAARLSAALRAPVLTLHNATLGGYSAWGMPPPEAQGAGLALTRRASRLAGRLAVEGRLARELIEARLAALIRPRIEWLLSGLAWHARLGGDEASYRRWLAECRPYLAGGDPPRLAFPFRARAELEERLTETLALAAAERERLPGQVARLAALWLSGRELMEEGRLKSLVIPARDKFIASSSRGLDVAYLAAWMRLLRSLAPEARCLLLDASPNPGSPSLRHAPARLSEAGTPSLGLGVFSQDGARPQTLREIMRQRRICLFIVEPLPCRGRRGAERLREADPALLARDGYDPAWKEAAPWLAAGTGLARFADPWLPPPPCAGLVLTSAGPLPGGRLYRHLLRPSGLSLDKI